MALVTLRRRSVSPKGIKNNFLIQAIGKKLIRRSREDSEEEDGRSSSTDSSSSSKSKESKRSSPQSSRHNRLRIFSSQHSSNSSVDGGTMIEGSTHIKNKRNYSMSADSIMKVFENLTISKRSKSCGSAADKEKKTSAKKNKKPPPKRILRSPVKYVYVKGWSGLPTQRIPVSKNYVGYQGGCRMQYIAGLSR